MTTFRDDVPDQPTDPRAEAFSLRAASGDYVAGDLDAVDTARFRTLLASEPEAGLADEVAFWQALRPAWSDSISRESLPDDFVDSVRARAGFAASAAAPRATMLRLPFWASAASAAAIAAGLVLALFIPRSPADAEMYAEDGAALSTTNPTGPWPDYAPRALISYVSKTAPDIGGEVLTSKAWAGLWTRPVRITQDSHLGGGHLVLRIAGGSPADRIGLRPGDIIRSIADCPVFTPSCVAHQLNIAHPGQVLRFAWWRPETGEDFQADMTLEVLYE